MVTRLIAASSPGACFALLSFAVIILGSEMALAEAPSPMQALSAMMEVEGVPDDLDAPWREFREGFEAFGNGYFMLQELLSLVIAAFLGSLIAFFPRGPAPMTPLEWERPRTIVLYTLVGAVVAELVLFNPPMAFVVFGIGGLMRFRSAVGSSRDTARTILATVVGLACGLKLFPVAVLATLFYWVASHVFRPSMPHKLEVRKLEPIQLAPALVAWRSGLESRGCKVVSQRGVPSKGRFEMLVLVPRRLDPQELTDTLDLPAELSGVPAWLVE